MRETLFRGKRTDNGEWVEGTYFPPANTLISYKLELIDGVVTFMDFCVIPETVGQYTGFTDKNGKKIFEGDIVKHFNASDVGVDIGKVCWDDKYCQFYRTSNSGMHNYRVGADCSYEVIGNIHDNPELLKGGEQ